MRTPARDNPKVRAHDRVLSRSAVVFDCYLVSFENDRKGLQASESGATSWFAGLQLKGGAMLGAVNQAILDFPPCQRLVSMGAKGG